MPIINDQIQQLIRDLRDNGLWSALVNPPTWIAPTFLNSWTNYGSGLVTAGYHKDTLGYVHIQGTVKNATGPAAWSAIFQIPAGYRPSAQLNFATASNGSFGLAIIDTNGYVYFLIGDATQFSINISPFLAEA